VAGGHPGRCCCRIGGQGRYRCQYDGGEHCEYNLRFAHDLPLSLRDQLPDVLAAMDRVAADDAACEKAGIAGNRAVDAAAAALDQAAAAEEVGAAEEAEAARAAAIRATAAANEVDAKVAALVDAAVEADSETDKAFWAAGQAAEAVRRLRGAAVATDADPAVPAPEPCRP
jgi:hypothetical protein